MTHSIVTKYELDILEIRQVFDTLMPDQTLKLRLPALLARQHYGAEV